MKNNNAWIILLSVVAGVALIYWVVSYKDHSIVSISPQTQTVAIAPTATPSVEETTPSPTQSISLSQVQIKNLTLSCGFNRNFPNCGSSEFALKGEVTNNSSIPFENIYMTIDAYDCPGSTIASDCTHVAKTTSADLMVDGDNVEQGFPPGLTKEALATAVDLNGIPPIQGNFLWSYSITSCTTSTVLGVGDDCGINNSFEAIPVTQ